MFSSEEGSGDGPISFRHVYNRLNQHHLQHPPPPGEPSLTLPSVLHELRSLLLSGHIREVSTTSGGGSAGLGGEERILDRMFVASTSPAPPTSGSATGSDSTRASSVSTGKCLGEGELSSCLLGKTNAPQEGDLELVFGALYVSNPPHAWACVYLCLSIYVSIYVSIYLSIYLLIHPYSHTFSDFPLLFAQSLQLSNGGAVTASQLLETIKNKTHWAGGEGAREALTDICKQLTQQGLIQTHLPSPEPMPAPVYLQRQSTLASYSILTTSVSYTYKSSRPDPHSTPLAPPLHTPVLCLGPFSNLLHRFSSPLHTSQILGIPLLHVLRCLRHFLPSYCDIMLHWDDSSPGNTVVPPHPSGHPDLSPPTHTTQQQTLQQESSLMSVDDICKRYLSAERREAWQRLVLPSCPSVSPTFPSSFPPSHTVLASTGGAQGAKGQRRKEKTKAVALEAAVWDVHRQVFAAVNACSQLLSQGGAGRGGDVDVNVIEQYVLGEGGGAGGRRGPVMRYCSIKDVLKCLDMIRLSEEQLGVDLAAVAGTHRGDVYIFENPFRQLCEVPEVQWCGFSWRLRALRDILVEVENAPTVDSDNTTVSAGPSTAEPEGGTLQGLLAAMTPRPSLTSGTGRGGGGGVLGPVGSPLSSLMRMVTCYDECIFGEACVSKGRKLTGMNAIRGYMHTALHWQRSVGPESKARPFRAFVSALMHQTRRNPTPKKAKGGAGGGSTPTTTKSTTDDDKTATTTIADKTTTTTTSDKSTRRMKPAKRIKREMLRQLSVCSEEEGGGLLRADLFAAVQGALSPRQPGQLSEEMLVLVLSKLVTKDMVLERPAQDGGERGMGECVSVSQEAEGGKDPVEQNHSSGSSSRYSGLMYCLNPCYRENLDATPVLCWEDTSTNGPVTPLRVFANVKEAATTVGSPVSRVLRACSTQGHGPVQITLGKVRVSVQFSWFDSAGKKELLRSIAGREVGGPLLDTLGESRTNAGQDKEENGTSFGHIDVSVLEGLAVGVGLSAEELQSYWKRGAAEANAGGRRGRPAGGGGMSKGRGSVPSGEGGGGGEGGREIESSGSSIGGTGGGRQEISRVARIAVQFLRLKTSQVCEL